MCAPSDAPLDNSEPDRVDLARSDLDAPTTTSAAVASTPAASTHTGKGAMTKPLTYLVRMLVFLAVVAAVTATLLPTLISAFNNNPLLDGLILGVLALGILWNLVTVARLNPEVRWLETLRHPRAGACSATIAEAAGADGVDDRVAQTAPTGSHLSTPAMRSLLDSLSSAPRREPRIVALHDRAADLPRPARHLLRPAADGERDFRGDRQPLDSAPATST